MFGTYSFSLPINEVTVVWTWVKYRALIGLL